MRCESGVQVGTDKPVMLLDADGTVAPEAAKALAAVSKERPSVTFVTGGSEAWQAADLPWKEPLQLPSLPSFEGIKGFDVSGVAAGTVMSSSDVLPGMIQELHNSEFTLLLWGQLIPLCVCACHNSIGYRCMELTHVFQGLRSWWRSTKRAPLWWGVESRWWPWRAPARFSSLKLSQFSRCRPPFEDP